MSFQGKLKRFLLILERVRYNPTFAELKDHLEEEGFAIGQRTLQRDIEQIRVELGLEITYDRPANTYGLPDSPDERDKVLTLLERAVLGEMLGSAEGMIRQAAPNVVFERKESMQGLQYWVPLMRAIQERREAVVRYRPFQADSERTMQLRPFQLKEHRGRWYALGTATGYDKPISLGLDRMHAVQLTSKRFAAKERAKVEQFYSPVIGVDASPGKAVRVVLRFTPLQGKYVKSLPMHHSQEVLRDDAEGCVVQLYVMPNYELRQELLGLGSTVEVLEPPSLRKAIAEEHRKAIRS